MFENNSAPPSGFVWLVGAGPGAADLLTLRGMRALQQAEVVLHDDLAGRELLDFCQKGTEFVYVGKRAGGHSAAQAEINWLLVSHAQAGRRVVRLKGGDPTVFGRLGEELQALREAQIPFEVVPGVTSACAAAAAAGISLTQRGIASAAIFATGHECAEKSGPTLDWQHLAQPGTTLCLYMGTKRLGDLATRLVASGHSPDTPLLIISNASRPNQIIRSGTLDTARELAADADGTPSLVLVGEIAAQNRELLAVHSRANRHHVAV